MIKKDDKLSELIVTSWMTVVTILRGIGDPGPLIARLLERLYALPLLAILREPLQNAIDATLANGGKIPDVVLTLPTRDDPTMSFKDAGKGLSVATMIGNYLPWGLSTKNSGAEAKTSSGGFAVGIKSLFTMLLQYTLMTTCLNKAGVLMTSIYSVYKDVALSAKELALMAWFEGKSGSVGELFGQLPESLRVKSQQEFEESLEKFRNASYISEKSDVYGPLTPQGAEELANATAEGRTCTSGGKVKARLEAEPFPGVQAGTTLSYPLEQKDFRAVYYTVSWLQAIMRETLGISFEVSNPEYLVQALPKAAGAAFYLEEQNPELKGWKVILMEDSALQLNLTSCMRGSLLVLGDEALGAGGLPFNVSALPDTDADYSIYGGGCLIFGPIAAVSVTPSREQVDMSATTIATLAAVEAAFWPLFFKRVRELLATPTLEAKQQVSRLLGVSTYANAAQHYARSSYGKIAEMFKAQTGLSGWKGEVPVLVPKNWSDYSADVRYFRGDVARFLAMEEPVASQSFMIAGRGVRATSSKLVLDTERPQAITLMVNDGVKKSNGMSRIRAYFVRKFGVKGNSSSNDRYLLIEADTTENAKLAAGAINAQFGNELNVVLASSLPDVAMVVRSGVLTSRKGGAGALAYYDFRAGSLLQVEAGSASLDAMSMDVNSHRVYLVRANPGLKGLASSVTVKSLHDYRSMKGSGVYGIAPLLGQFNLTRLYVLTGAQEKELLAMQEEAQSEGLFDRDRDEFDSIGEFEHIEALRRWTPLVSFAEKIASSQLVQDAIRGATLTGEIAPIHISDSYELGLLLRCMAFRAEGASLLPAKVVQNSRLDKWLFAKGLFDTVSNHPLSLGSNSTTVVARGQIVASLLVLASLLAPEALENKELLEELAKVEAIPVLDYKVVYWELLNEFPLLKLATQHTLNAWNRHHAEWQPAMDGLLLAASK